MGQSEAFDFDAAFCGLAGHIPFPWQRELYSRFICGEFPSVCNIPTGLGKTAVIPIWFLAFAEAPALVPRRMVYVVNRRTVVDQTTDEVEKLRHNLATKPELEGLKKLVPSLPISTLRGQFADNREWSADPSRPAVICGTVDMIGSRLLFSGYGVGFKAKPLHAGFLGQDALLVHDEAHLEPAFQKLLIAIEKEQNRCNEFATFRVMELSATSRSNISGDGKEAPFTLSDRDRAEPEVKKRIYARKSLYLQENADEKKLADEIAEFALNFKDTGRAVLVFVRKVEDVEKAVGKLRKEKLNVQQLTGTLRGLERDKLATEDRIFCRFLAPSSKPKGIEPADGTAYLVCTSAGEVGVNLSADHLVCDLTTFESMAQRFGRVNRFGIRDDTEIHVVHPQGFDKDNEYDMRLEKTLDLLRRLNGDGSPQALDEMPHTDRLAAFAPTPTILETSDILFDSWALTTIRGKLPGRPPVEPYLHGIAEWDPPQTQVAWREEVGIITDGLLETYKPEDLLDDYPLKPHELLRDRSDRVFKHLVKIAARRPDDRAWLLDNEGHVEVCALKELANNDKKERINNRTVLLPPKVGGLRDGMLHGDSETANDAADQWFEDAEKKVQRRVRVWDDDPDLKEKTKDMRRARPPIDTRPDTDEDDEDTSGKRFWHWYESRMGGDSDSSKFARKPVLLQIHTDDVVRNAERLLESLPLTEELKRAIVLAAKLHDFGKRRPLFQRILGNSDLNIILAKSGRRSSRIPEQYRHEFGSLLDAVDQDKFKAFDGKPELQDLVLHLIAAHHGRGRPHFPADEAFDPERAEVEWHRIAAEVPRRFARLQRKYGRWGLAYLESLLRAADWAASANPSACVDNEKDQP